MKKIQWWYCTLCALRCCIQLAFLLFFSPIQLLKVSFPSLFHHYHSFFPTVLFWTPQFNSHCCLFFSFTLWCCNSANYNAILHLNLLLSSAISRSLQPSSSFLSSPVPLNPQFFLSMVLSLSLVIMVQITGGREAPHLSRGRNQTLQVGLCQQGRQPAAADWTQRKATVSKSL